MGSLINTRSPQGRIHRKSSERGCANWGGAPNTSEGAKWNGGEWKGWRINTPESRGMGTIGFETDDATQHKGARVKARGDGGGTETTGRVPWWKAKKGSFNDARNEKGERGDIRLVTGAFSKGGQRYKRSREVYREEFGSSVAVKKT